MQDLALDDSRHLLDLAELCLNRISELCDTRRDQAHFASACRALRETTPRQALAISGPDFTLRGPHGGHWAPEAYFQTPALPAALAGLKMSLAWKDQGWGNRKGTIVVRLMRRPPRDEVEAVVAEDTSLFGVAPHAWEDGLVELDAAHPIVSQAEAGDTLSFLRNAGPLLAPPRVFERPSREALLLSRALCIACRRRRRPLPLGQVVSCRARPAPWRHWVGDG